MLNNFFVARQPIFDHYGKLWAFELLFRTGLSENAAVIDDPDAATVLVASGGFLRATSGIPENVRIFINFTEELIFQRFPLALPPQNTVIEILENIPVTPKLVERLRELKAEGYIIALDDFVGDPGYKDIFPYIDIIKLDCLGRTTDEVIDIKNRFSGTRCKFLAEKVDSEAAFTAFREQGISFFQGYYFAKPQILSGKGLTSSSAIRLKLAAEIEKNVLDTDAILAAVQSDVSLSYRLLQYINSSAFSFREKITSIRQALTLLGVMKTKYWLRLMLYSDMLSTNSNPEVLRMALQRAHFLDALGVASKFAAPKNESMFLVGMLSLLEAILGVPMATILKELPLSADIKASLRGERGIYSDYIALAVAMEHLDFDRANRLAKVLHIPENVVSESFELAIGISDTMMNQISGV
ncbi:HDOD domain-containing protein [Desulfovibrio sp.]|uniref:EAL and HDOD domain-containing protein n=1 Tax=Desulfovibrio sp. TaxID=885 RepID=UPI0025B9FAF7|nr:HDOD domain-containing protein [Desulfovibrio sp.]